MNKIDVKNITKVFGKNPRRAVDMLKQGLKKPEIFKKTGMTVGVNQADFYVKEGEIFVIMGLSGSGKSTLVRLINRLIEPTSGEIHIDGQDITKMNKQELRQVRQKKISMVFQRFALFPHRTILENTEYGLEIQGMSKDERREKATKALELVGLKGYEHQNPNELSGGMQQRVGLARALASDTDILLMDEAFSALDPLIRKDMQNELLDLQSDMHKTIVFITHDLDEALRIGDRIALMKDGSIVQVGTPEEILMNPANRYVEQFVEDVDMSKVIVASNIMIRPETIFIDRGPRVALQLMRDEGISSIYAVDKGKKFLGIISADDALEATKTGKSCREIVKEVVTVKLDTLLNDLFEDMNHSPVPLPVVDDEGRLRGIVKRAEIIAALSGDQDALNGNGVKL
ncbi:glycine betaine/L-proline ABC transporter ATP-binding protein ProV [Terrilactibacillus sp. BCM23-1]|uniref:Quaternary amine transport ATP-binding protein n=1 Tax=Terrilactibacillus tamarindi TaxID=2599694 RepID=A0A6N8CWD7_9BACI|nr:glycine betaine/L-proline ABC transporter ATP-binding protein ProV [Terrilactibacillus tamarindi]MTT32936.1 glycine betaine/L-proline ABC transporter ATP-binding protein ProV [Terrilactibacillus tamarindi]